MILLLSCVTLHLPVPTEDMVRAAEQEEVSLESLNQGRRLLLQRCGNCHAVPEPWVTNSPQWPEVFASMSEEAELTPEEQKLIETYLRAGRGF